LGALLRQSGKSGFVIKSHEKTLQASEHQAAKEIPSAASGSRSAVFYKLFAGRERQTGGNEWMKLAVV
jgi:hypothetical protein